MSFLTRLETIDRSSKEWECTVNKPACQVFKLKEDSPVVLVKAFATFAGLPASIVSHFIRHIPTRMKWYAHIKASTLIVDCLSSGVFLLKQGQNV